MKVTVYEKNNCVQCEATKRWLRRASIEFDTINLEESPEAMDKVKAMGYSAAPVVITDVDSWSGFRASKFSTKGKGNGTRVVCFLAETDNEWFVQLIYRAHVYEYLIEKRGILTSAQRSNNMIAGKFFGRTQTKLLTEDDLGI